MTQKIFGTDGVRGRANCPPMTPEFALRLGQAVARRFRRGNERGRAVIGKDTRRSGYMLEGALQAGFTAGGMDVFLVGPAPTPAIGMLTRSLRADVGVMISASHNLFEDNGVKLFGPDGFKLSDEAEAALEADMASAPDRAGPADIGRAKRVDGGVSRYVEFAKASFPRTMRLDGLRIVVDCAHGAGYRATPTALWELGAEVIEVGCAPNGFNINAGVGSTDLEACRQAVLAHGAALGVALDGDADRLILIDETGAAIDGDQILGLIALRWAGLGRLAGGAIAATVMTNLGLERRLADAGLSVIRTPVGDRHVVEAMRARGLNVGGEQSGHVILTDFSTTGDGLIAALQALAVLVDAGEPASRSLRVFTPTPQMLRSERAVGGAALMAAESVGRVLRDAAARLEARGGRLLVRPSGTEPVLRVMAECEDEGLLSAAVEDVCTAIRSASATQAAR